MKPAAVNIMWWGAKLICRNYLIVGTQQCSLINKDGIQNWVRRGDPLGRPKPHDLLETAII